MSAPSTKVVVVASRSGGLSGVLQFKVLSSGTISTSSGSISVSSGATVSIDFASSSGSLWIGADGWMSASGIGVNAIYVNGNRVAGSTTITGVTNVRVDLSSLMTSLTLTISGSGWTQITYGGQTLVSGTDSRTIVIPNIAATSSQPLNLNMGSNSIYLEATSNQPQIGVATTTTMTTTTPTTTTTPRTTTTTSPTTTTTTTTTPRTTTTTTITSVVTTTTTTVTYATVYVPLTTVVNVPVTASTVFTVTSPVTTTVTARTTTTIPVTIVMTATLTVPTTVTQTVTQTITRTTTISPTTTVTSPIATTTTAPATTTGTITVINQSITLVAGAGTYTVIGRGGSDASRYPALVVDADADGQADFVVEPNLWNVVNANGQVAMVVTVRGSRDYTLNVNINLQNIQQQDSSGWVHAYPEIWFGAKPWNTVGPALDAFISGSATLPIKVSQLQSTNVCVYVGSYQVTRVDTNLPFNFVFETWLTRDTTRGRTVTSNEVEVMVWFAYYQLQGAGSVVANPTVTIYINGQATSQQYELWRSGSVGSGGWEYFAFRPTTSRESANRVAFCWRDFINVARQYSDRSDWDNLYLTSSELGTEFGSPSYLNAQLQWSVTNYWLSVGVYTR